MPRALKAFWAVVAVAFAAYTVRTLVWGDALTTLFDVGVSSFLLAAGAFSCLVRAALVRDGRAPWLAAGLGLALWTSGDLYWSLMFAGDPSPPFPSLADPFYLLQYPAFYAALLLLVRSRPRPLAGSLGSTARWGRSRLEPWSPRSRSTRSSRQPRAAASRSRSAWPIPSST